MKKKINKNNFVETKDFFNNHHVEQNFFPVL